MAIEKPEWFKLNPAKFLSDRKVDAMSTLEFGACVRLLCRQWMDGDIPDDVTLLARHCRLSEAEMREVWPMLSDFFPVVGPGRRANRFMWIERERVTEELERMSDAGTRAARKRWDEVKSKRNSANNAPSNTAGNADGNAEGNASGTGAAIQDQTRVEQTRPERRAAEETTKAFSDGREAAPPNEDHKENGQDLLVDDDDPTAEEWPPSALARHLLETLCVPIDPTLLQAVSESIRTKAKAEKISPAAAHDLILPKAALAKQQGVRKWLFWFRDEEYNKKSRLDATNDWLREHSDDAR